VRSGVDVFQSLLGLEDREALRAIAGERVRFDEPLAPYTSFQVGGPADAFVEVETSDEVATLLQLVRKRHLPFFVLGYGSNLLIGDGGIRGIVLRLGGSFATIAVREEENAVVVEAGASASMALLTTQAASRGAVGIASLVGIPGSVGGVLCMNAGTDHEAGEFVREVWTQTLSKPDPHLVTLRYFYRHTTLARDAVVARVLFAFKRGDSQTVRAEMQQRLVRRKKTQPLQLPNAGSCFRNPSGDKAGRLLEEIGAKGRRVGGAEVSTLHANFIVNRDNASASDIAALLAQVRREVAERLGVELELEVHFVGVFT
jgi:UDP-N-acetylmuramate dehydrogenase